MKQMPQNPAVFSRNHAHYLSWAAELAVTKPEGLVTFRSSKEWVGAEKLLSKAPNGKLAIYFAVVDQGPEVKYKGWVREILLKPNSGTGIAKRLLESVPPGTESEGIWQEDGGTLYTISGCGLVEQPFPISDLIKLNGGTPLSLDFGYSYSLVHALGE